MSHTLGVRCATHCVEMEPDTCPERGCYGEHGWTAQPCDSRCPQYKPTEGDTMATPEKKCTRHGRRQCWSCRDEVADNSGRGYNTDNTGQVGIDNQGDLTIGIGGGLGIDTSDGSLTFGSGGFSIDTDGQ